MTDARPWRRIEHDDGVVFREVTLADVEGVFIVHSDPRVYELDPHLAHRSLTASREFLLPYIAHWETHGFGYWAVLVPRRLWPDGPVSADPRDGDRVFAGMGGIMHRTVVDPSVLNIYYRLAPEVQGNGIAGRIVDASVATANAAAPGIDLVVRTRPANAAARRVATRAGFIDEGLEPGTDDMQLLRLSRRQT